MSPSDEVLLAALPGATHVARRPYPYATSCPLTELTVAFPDGTRRLLLKELVAAPGRPADKPPPGREAHVYRRLLAAEGIGPELLASGADWLVLELVDGVELWQVGDPSRWAHVARWLGRLHRRFADRGAELRAAGLTPLTAEQLNEWLVRAEPHVTGRGGVHQLVSSHRCAHPGLHFKIDDQIAEEDRVATRWHATVPASRPQDPLAPAGRTAFYVGISITRLLAGKQVDSHTECTELAAPPAATAMPAEWHRA